MGLKLEQCELRTTNEISEAGTRQYDAPLLRKRIINCWGCKQEFPGGSTAHHYSSSKGWFQHFQGCGTKDVLARFATVWSFSRCHKAMSNKHGVFLSFQFLKDIEILETCYTAWDAGRYSSKRKLNLGYQFWKFYQLQGKLLLLLLDWSLKMFLVKIAVYLQVLPSLHRLTRH